jgi:hypothetical protein
VLNTAESAANNCEIKSSPPDVSVCDNYSDSNNSDILSLPEDTETTTGAGMEKSNTGTVIIISNDAAAPADFNPLESVFSMKRHSSDILEAYEEIAVTNYVIKAPLTCNEGSEQPLAQLPPAQAASPEQGTDEVTDSETPATVEPAYLIEHLFDYATLDSCFRLRRGTLDRNEEFPAADSPRIVQAPWLQGTHGPIEDDHAELGADVQHLCEISLAEFDLHHECTGKVNMNDMMVIQQHRAYGHEIYADDHDLCAPLSDPASTVKLATGNSALDDRLTSRHGRHS